MDHQIFSQTAYFERPYRYWLRRNLSLLNQRPLLGIGINPSKAGRVTNDPTTTIMCNLTRANNFGIWCAMNGRAYVATDPKDMPAMETAIGPRNDQLIREAINWIDNQGGAYLLFWGNHGAEGNRDRTILEMLGNREIYCLGHNINGSPKFPRAIKSNTRFQLFKHKR